MFGKTGVAAVSRSPLHLCITSPTASTFKESACSSAFRRENSLRASTFLACARQHPSGRAWWQRAFSGRRAPPGHHQGTDMATCVVRLSPTLLRKAADRRAEGRALERRAVKISNIFFFCLRKKKRKGKAGHTSRAQERRRRLHYCMLPRRGNIFTFFFLFSPPSFPLITM